MKKSKRNIKMKITINNFTNYEQQLFLSSFYCYLKYDSKKDYVIDLDNVWKWLGFQQKYHAKYLLEKHFHINKDYKLLLLQTAKQDDKTHWCHNILIFLMYYIQIFKKGFQPILISNFSSV